MGFTQHTILQPIKFLGAPRIFTVQTGPFDWISIECRSIRTERNTRLFWGACARHVCCRLQHHFDHPQECSSAGTVIAKKNPFGCSCLLQGSSLLRMPLWTDDSEVTLTFWTTFAGRMEHPE
jgi:hypothetical protein